jgi:hypothetical protein
MRLSYAKWTDGFRPKMTMNAEVWWKTERPLSATLQQISTTSQN